MPVLPVTDWFPADVKPAHVGVYERQGQGMPYSFWDGTQWMLPGDTPAEAAQHFNFRSTWQAEPWRGLQEKSDA
jgi:hypothetical protein